MTKAFEQDADSVGVEDVNPPGHADRCTCNGLQASRFEQTRSLLNLPDEPFPLEIAAGERPTLGFIHNDARALPHIEIVSDARDELVRIVGQGNVSSLRACHVLEHFPYGETVNVLSLWRSMLAPGGDIHIEVPNLSWQVVALVEGQISDAEFVYYCYGEQNYAGNFHCAGFTDALLRQRLSEAGFFNVNVVDIGQVLVADAISVK